MNAVAVNENTEEPSAKRWRSIWSYPLEVESTQQRVEKFLGAAAGGIMLLGGLVMMSPLPATAGLCLLAVTLYRMIGTGKRYAAWEKFLEHHDDYPLATYNRKIMHAEAKNELCVTTMIAEGDCDLVTPETTMDERHELVRQRAEKAGLKLAALEIDSRIYERVMFHSANGRNLTSLVEAFGNRYFRSEVTYLKSHMKRINAK